MLLGTGLIYFREFVCSKFLEYERNGLSRRRASASVTFCPLADVTRPTLLTQHYSSNRAMHNCGNKKTSYGTTKASGGTANYDA